MAGDHACPVCQARFTRPQHVTRHMRSHTGDRPYNCTQCGDRFARSDLLSRHVNKCHNGTPSTSTQRGNRRHTHTSSTSSANSVNLSHPNPAETPCDSCLAVRQQCDLGNPCGKCILRKSPCTYTAKARNVASSSGHARRVSLPSLTQTSQQPFNLLGQAPQAGLGSYNQSSGLGLPAYGLGQYGQTNGVGFAGASTLDRSAVPGSLPPLSGGQPVPMPNGQYVDSYSSYPSSMFAQDQQQQPSPLNGLGGPLPRLGSLSYAGQQSQQPDTQFSSRPPSLEQAYDFGNSNVLPSLSQDFDGATDPKAASAAYLQQRRGSLQLPGSQSHQASFHYQVPGPDGLGSGQSFQSPQQPVHGSPASLSRHFDPSRINERLASIRGGYHPAIDDGSSVSDFGSNNSGAPSPVPSSQSISGFSASSRPTSSAGSGGVGRDGTAAPSAGDTFTSSLQGAIPLPTPLQLGSFNSFQSQNNPMNDRTPGATAEGGAGGKIFPPYQNFENMNLDEQAASFAAAAKHASNNGTYGGNGTSSSWNPGQQYGSLGVPTPSHYPVLSAGGKERAINELKDFWSAFISEPLSAGGSAAINGNNGNGNGHSLQKQLSMPSLKTPLPLSSERTSMLDLNHPTPRTLYPNSGHQSILGMMFKPEPSSLSSSNRPPNNSNIKLDNPSEGSQNNTTDTASVQPPAPVIGDQEAENLRSYQEACLRRETPMLRLQPRPKSRIIKSSSLSPQFGGDSKKLPGVDGMVGGESASMKVDGPNKSMVAKGSISNAPVFAEPFPPDSKEARDWHHYRAQATAATDLHQAASTASAARPTYKRLPSTTLGPESSKKARDEGDADVSGQEAPATYQVSFPQPGYGAAGGNAHSAWMRQRSMSSPSSMRPHFDWQSFGTQRT